MAAVIHMHDTRFWTVIPTETWMDHMDQRHQNQ